MAGRSRNATELPALIKPQLATLFEGLPPRPDEYIYEIKFDGYRMLTRIQGKSIKIFTRNGNDWTAKLEPMRKALAQSRLPDGWYDGEMVVMGANELPDFNALQNAIDNLHTANITYFLFDAPFLNGEDMRERSVVTRRQRLSNVLVNAHPSIRFSAAFDGGVRDITGSACRLGLEGVIGKRKESTYVHDRSPNWIKLKCSLRQEFAVVGFTNRSGSTHEVGGLMLGYHERGKLRYGGNVGTGWDAQTAQELHKALVKLESKEPAIDPATVTPGRFSRRSKSSEPIRWVRPQMVVEVSFAEWTPEGRVRHPTFRGRRDDKPATQIVRERAQSAAGGAAPAPGVQSVLPKGLKVSNPERVIDHVSGITKIELVRYYALVAPLMMPHLKGRPVALVRAPQGLAGQQFFQKHEEKSLIDGMAELPEALRPGHGTMLEAVRPVSLPAAAQMNVIEWHTWNAVKSNILKPDRFTLDLDPGEGVTWVQIQEAALLVRTMLTELGLPAYLKTSGGTGLHVVVPIKRQYGWDEVKDFSEAIVKHIARLIPDRFVAKLGPKNRVGKIFIDYLRNGWGATTVSAWSARAREGMGISVPVRWEELAGLTGGAHWTIRDVHDRLDDGNSPWDGYDKAGKSISAAMKRLGM